MERLWRKGVCNNTKICPIREDDLDSEKDRFFFVKRWRPILSQVRRRFNPLKLEPISLILHLPSFLVSCWEHRGKLLKEFRQAISSENRAFFILFCPSVQVNGKREEVFCICRLLSEFIACSMGNFGLIYSGILLIYKIVVFILYIQFSSKMATTLKNVHAKLQIYGSMNYDG